MKKWIYPEMRTNKTKKYFYSLRTKQPVIIDIHTRYQLIEVNDTNLNNKNIF
jgi:hypothetical protein